MLSLSSFESLKGFCCEKNSTSSHQQMLDSSSSSISIAISTNSTNVCRNPTFIGDTQYRALLLLHDLYYLFNESKVEPKDLVYAGIARNRKVAWVYLKRLRKLCVIDERNNINIERVEELLRLPIRIRMIGHGIKRSKPLYRKGSRRCR
jgi:hypothetical protein